MNLVLHIFLCGDKHRLRQFFVVARDFDLLAVFVHLFGGVGERRKLLEFLLEVVLHLHGNLIGTFGDDAHRFVDVAGIGRHLDHVTSDSVEGSVYFLVIHIICWRN